MKEIFSSCLSILLLFVTLPGQTPQTPQKPQTENAPEDVVRISTELVQTDVVVTDKNDQVIPDLKLEDFKVYENGKRQDLKFMEFVGPQAEPRLEGSIAVGDQRVDPEVARNLSPKELRRVFAFVVDDLTIPLEDIVSVRNLLTNFVDTQMREGDLVAILRVIGGNGLLQQFTSDRRLLRRAIAQITPRLHAYSVFNNL